MSDALAPEWVECSEHGRFEGTSRCPVCTPCGKWTVYLPNGDHEHIDGYPKVEAAALLFMSDGRGPAFPRLVRAFSPSGWSRLEPGVHGLVSPVRSQP